MINQFMKDIGHLVKDLEKEDHSSLSRIYEKKANDDKPGSRYEYHTTSKFLDRDERKSK
ncbi:hypothetical protein ACE1TI_11665 [Alteribacillus sp. JSM 102045]|uniref:hypothetical protein n=1 Tax=Alteribacillus sp. JSM 102045 TaxID=1562101 RepID=UPI0035C23C5A